MFAISTLISSTFHFKIWQVTVVIDYYKIVFAHAYRKEWIMI